MNFSQKIIDWTYLGTSYARSDAERRHIIFSNVIFLTLPIVYAVFIIIDFRSFFQSEGLLQFDQLVVPLSILLCACYLLLNKIGLTSLSRILFLVTWLMIFHVLPIMFHHSPSDYYIAFPLGIIFHSVLIHVSFSSRKEPVKFWSFIVLNFIVMLNVKSILVAYDLSPESGNVLRTDPYFQLDIVLYWLLFNLLMYYMFYVVEYYISRIHNARAMITRQSDELVLKNGKLEHAVYSLRLVNQQVEDLNKDLENKVLERTRALQQMNNKLVDYAFINAHQLRGPFCRVKGLIVLRNAIAKPTGEEERIDALLMQCIDELDQVTIKIQKAIETNEQDLELIYHR